MWLLHYRPDVLDGGEAARISVDGNDVSVCIALSIHNAAQFTERVDFL